MSIKNNSLPKVLYRIPCKCNNRRIHKYITARTASPKKLSVELLKITKIFNFKLTLSIAHYQKIKSFEKEMTLKQACSQEYLRAQCAFKNSMIHEYLQFTLLIAIRYVLHRCENQEIRC